MGNVQARQVRCVFVNCYIGRNQRLFRTKEKRTTEIYGSDDYTLLTISDEALEVAEQIINLGILTKKSFDDCQHIGTAVVNECDCIISWNFKHIVNVKTIRGVRAIANFKEHKPIEIWNPSVLLESE